MSDEKPPHIKIAEVMGWRLAGTWPCTCGACCLDCGFPPPGTDVSGLTVCCGVPGEYTYVIPRYDRTAC